MIFAKYQNIQDKAKELFDHHFHSWYVLTFPSGLITENLTFYKVLYFSFFVQRIYTT